MHPNIDVNGLICTLDTAPINISDLAFMRGYGIFDFFQIAHRQILFEEAYWNRFQSSAAMCRINLSIELEQLRSRISAVCQANGSDDGFIKLLFTAGHSKNGATPDGEPNLAIIQYPAKKFDSMLERHRLQLQKFEREAFAVKSLNYANVIMQYPQLNANGFLDLLYHDGHYISESSRANFFIVDRHGCLKTNPSDILAGITRKQLLKVAEGEEEIVLSPIAISDLLSAQEAFITSTTKLIWPIVGVNNYSINGGDTGPVTKKLYRLLKDHYTNEIERLSLATA